MVGKAVFSSAMDSRIEQQFGHRAEQLIPLGAIFSHEISAARMKFKRRVRSIVHEQKPWHKRGESSDCGASSEFEKIQKCRSARKTSRGK